MSMIINPFRFGSGPPPGTFTPNILSGLTFAYHAYASTMYKGGSTSDGLATVNGDTVARIDSDQSISRTLYDNNAGTRPTLVSSAFGTGLPGVRQASGSDFMIGYARPVGTAIPTSFLTLDDLFNNNAKLMIWAGFVVQANTPQAAVYSNAMVAGSLNQYCGLHASQTGGTITFYWFNWQSGAVSVTTTEATSTPCVIACRHDAGNLRIAKNGVSWGSPAASGNTANMTGQFQTNQTSIAPQMDMTTAALVTCDASSSDADILTVVQQMGALVGLSL